MQSRNLLLRMNLTYQGLNSSVGEQRASLVSSQCTKLCIGGVIQETCYQQMPQLFPIQLRSGGGILYSVE